MKIKYLFMSVLFLAITACDTDTEEPNSSDFEFTQVFSGDADFSSYVAMGGGVTAGMTDNSLFMAGQMGSYPNIMASVMSQTDTGGEFTQPYVDDNVGGINVGGNQFWPPRFFFDGAGPVYGLIIRYPYRCGNGRSRSIEKQWACRSWLVRYCYSRSHGGTDRSIRLKR